MKITEFDTRDKKPNLYYLLIMTGIVFFIVGWLLLDEKTNAAAVSMVLEVYFAAALVLLISTFIKQLQYNPYSYNTIMYTGFALYVIFLLRGRVEALVS